MTRTLLISGYILVLLVGCVAPPVALDPRVQAELTTAETVLIMPKPTLGVDVNPTAIGGGLLDQLLASFNDTKRRASATEAARPITAQLEGIDIRANLQAAWQQAYAAAGVARLATPLRIETLAVDAPDWGPRRRALFDASDAQAVFYALVDYRLQSGVLRIDCRLEGYPKASELLVFRKSPDAADPLAEGNAIYRKQFAYAREFVTANNVRRYIDEGVRDVTRQIAQDLAGPAP
jgi:hypothetical protein